MCYKNGNVLVASLFIIYPLEIELSIENMNNRYDVTHPIYAKISTLSYKKQMKMDISKKKLHQNEKVKY
jgi:hypothetical protein